MAQVRDERPAPAVLPPAPSLTPVHDGEFQHEPNDPQCAESVDETGVPRVGSTFPA